MVLVKKDEEFCGEPRMTANPAAQTASTPHILGISAGDHDAAAAIFRGPSPLVALEEEKLVRVRRARGLPVQAIHYCLEAARLKPEQMDYIALARPLFEGSGERAGEASWIPKRLKQE